MEIHEGAEAISVRTASYRLEASTTTPSVRLTDADGGAPMRLMLLAALDSDRGLDGTLAVAAPRLERGENRCHLAFETTSSLWAAKTLSLRCTDDAVTMAVAVRGEGRLTEVSLLGGWYSGDPGWGGGRFHSRWSARTVFDPSPDDPARLVQPATEPATIGVIGGSMPGRGHWFFTPAPFLFAGTEAEVSDPEAAPAWTTLELACDVEAATFTELRYAPFLDGFSIQLAYDGATPVRGTFTTPPLVIRFGVRDPYAAVAAHGDRLRAADLARTVERRPAAWWTRPIFCGWGEQCRRARLDQGSAKTLSRRDLYDEWLATLAEHRIVPGTVVIDDKWQATYGRNEPDIERWPDLRGWIADRHAADQRVLLWFKAWDPDGLPLDACVTDALGSPVAADPTSAAYEAILRDSLHAMLGPSGLDADGLKVDFTAQTPAGPGLRRAGEAWGVALLHRLLELVHRFAKEAKPDALVVTHAASPLFADVTDMLRLNDLMRLADPDPVVRAVPQMRHRARVAAAVDPGLLIDTDDWCMPSRAEWRAYLAAKPELGVPALYYATGIDYSGEPFTDADYAAIREAWAAWEARRLQVAAQ